MYLLCEIEDGNFDNFILKNTPRLDVYLPPGSTSNTLQRKPTKTALRKWLYLDQEVRKQIKTDPVKALSILEENRVLNEKQKAAKSLEDDFFKLQQKNLEIQKKRAKELDELHCVKGQLDKLKQDASRLWKEKEYFKRELQANDISVLQHQIAEEKAKVLELTNKIQSLSKEKENLLTRLSEVAGCKLTSNNPAITDLSDENRPFKLAEKFSQLYDDEWTDSLEEITSIGIDEETSISFLLNVVMTAFQLCYRQTMLLSLKDCRTVMWCDSPNLKRSSKLNGPLKDVVTVDKETTFPRHRRYKNRLAESARGDFSKPCYEKYIQEGFLLDKESIEELLLGPIKRFAKTAQFADHCVELCSSMRSIQPPVHLSASIPENRELKHDVFKAYTKSGKVIDYIVWPAMYLHEKGPLLSKGVAQPK
ncbi:uncharacterized protein LOC133192856 [Saccostrea echinata]|uniref:uncharacterized protein LOC133192856 n=1 Tax=Saccostrea echinata TaxID=191078 RepID=UPI002A80415D|nr:uncharacterized protein LOC133192856 [Saccostrea echinata]